ncbi:hypothetical protein FQR65_LT09688 [Abscondita terminalis]|nr:hypothetical protein FQR65_LT09688 [Abscondita terminalis]
MIIGPMFLFFTLSSILIAENLKNGLHVFIQKSEEQLSTEAEHITGIDGSINLTKMLETPMQPLTSSVRKCPNGLSYYEHLGMPFCYVFTQKHPHPFKCPYKNYIKDDIVKEIYDKFKNETIWVKARRNLNDQFGEFEWLEMSTRYLDAVTTYIINNNTISDKNCMIVLNYTLIAVHCDEEHSSLCIYSYSVQSMSKYCSKHNNFINCISTNLDTDNNCYCQVTTTGLEVSRNTFCKQFAEPDSFQNHLLLTQLPYKEPCWFGVEQVDGVLKWLSTKGSLEYSSWNVNTNFSKKYGAFDYINQDWFLTDDFSLKCAICQVHIPTTNTSIDLIQLPHTNHIQIKIDNIFEIHDDNMHQYLLACFSDYDTKNIKKRITASVSDVSPITSPTITIIVSIDHFYPAYYWCESIQRPSFTPIVSNKILVYNDIGKHHHEYALTIEIPVPIGVDPYLHKLYIIATNVVYRRLSIFSFLNVARPVKIKKFSEKIHTMELIIHISTGKNNLTATAEYFLLNAELNALSKEKPNIIKKIISFYRSEVCLESTTTSGNLTLHWLEAFTGKTILPKELCLLKDSSPVTRTCSGDFVSGAYWSAVKGVCYNQTISNRTLKLYNILNNETDEANLARSLLNTTINSTDVLVVDVHLISEILERLQEISKFSLIEVVKIVSNIMFYETNVMKRAQLQLNSTDITLYALDNILINSKIDYTNSVQTVLTKNVIVQVSHLETSIIAGSILQCASKKTNGSFDGYGIKPLYKTDINSLMDIDFEVAVIASNGLINQMKNVKKNSNIKNDFIISFFRKDALFNHWRKQDKNHHMVVNVLIPKLKYELLYNPIYIITKLNDTNYRYNCVHWKYGLNDMVEHIRGSWIIDGEAEIRRGKNLYAICKYNHATHYSLLISTKDVRTIQPPEINLALNIITTSGCVLSLIGLIGIFIIAILFKRWRKRTRNIIMLNFSAALTAQTILLFIADVIDKNTIQCTTIGASLHYTVLCGFSWMVVVAILQYRKFVLVFQQSVPHFLTKCIFFGWGISLLPVLVILIAFPKGYNMNRNGLCYPEGNYFYYGVLMPICIFCLINLFIFVKILVSIFGSKVEKYGGNTNKVRLHVSIAILLFFLLGDDIQLYGFAGAPEKANGA